MRMRANNQARPAVGEVAQRPFFARRFGMDVDDGGVAGVAQGACGKLPFNGGERIVERVHEDAAEHVDDQQPRSLRAAHDHSAPSGRASRIVDGSDETWLAFDEYERLALIEGVVAERHRVDADGEEFLEDRLGETKAAGCVLAIDDDEIEVPARAQKRNMFNDCRASRAPNHIADKEQPHQCSPTKMVSRSVTIASKLWSCASYGTAATSQTP